MATTSPDFGLPAFRSYDAAAAESLLTEFGTLTTFAEVEDWDARAAQQMEAIAAYLAKLATTEAEVNNAEARAIEAAAKQSLFRRLIGSAPGVSAARDWKTQAVKTREALADLADRLQAAIDKTPNSREEQKEMLQELRLAKKELAIQKREVGEAMRQIRTEARQRSAKVGSGLGIVFSNSRSRRFSRMAIRLEKEGAVKPHESARSQIERQILIIDRAIHWIERFK